MVYHVFGFLNSKAGKHAGTPVTDFPRRFTWFVHDFTAGQWHSQDYFTQHSTGHVKRYMCNQGISNWRFAYSSCILKQYMYYIFQLQPQKYKHSLTKYKVSLETDMNINIKANCMFMLFCQLVDWVVSTICKQEMEIERADIPKRDRFLPINPGKHMYKYKLFNGK